MQGLQLEKRPELVTDTRGKVEYPVLRSTPLDAKLADQLSRKPSGDQHVPPKAFLQSGEHGFRHGCKPGRDLVFVLNILLDHEGEYVILPNVQNVKSFKQTSDFLAGERKRYGTTALSLRLIESTFDHNIFPRILCVKHYPEFR